jgi:dephospho-CoA kinase
MLVIGLTGGIGSGKTTVAKLFAERKIPIIDADVIAHEITKPDSPAFIDIVEHFGKKVVMADGSLDRMKLRSMIFNDPNQRRWLEYLLHPVIRKEMERQIKKLKTPYCIAVIPLLVEVEFYSFIDRILVIDAPESQQIERIMTRDQASKEHIESILKSQATRKARVAKAQDLIMNDGIVENLVPQVEKLHRMYLGLSGGG